MSEEEESPTVVIDDPEPADKETQEVVEETETTNPTSGTSAASEEETKSSVDALPPDLDTPGLDLNALMRANSEKAE